MMKKVFPGVMGLLLVALAMGLYFKGGPEKINRENDPLAGLSQKQIKQFKLQKKPRAWDNPKLDQPDMFQKIHAKIRTRHGEEAPSYPKNYRHSALAKARKFQKENQGNWRTTSYDFIERGPSNVPGRTRVILVDASDPSQNTLFAGSTGGGIWKSIDGGQNWIPLTENMPNLVISSMVQAPSNPDVFYAGTGEAAVQGSFIATGDGIYKSTDHGDTWVHLDAYQELENFQNIHRMAIDPADENTLVVAAVSDKTNVPGSAGAFSSIYRTEDGGNTWQEVYVSGTSQQVQDLKADPKNFNILYAGVRNFGVIKSTNGGKSWFPAKSGIGIVGRVEIAIAKNNTNYIYASCEGTTAGTRSDLYFSKNGGQDWALVTDANGSNVDWLGAQGWYDNTLTVHPFNDKIIYIGGIEMWRMEIDDNIETSEIKGFLGIDEVNTQSFINSDIYIDQENENLGDEYRVSFEIRFGTGQSQKAHRFTVPPGSTSGVSPANYTYADYVDVPFEVWDIENNRQLMVSFRDNANDGTFNLTTNQNTSREYITVHTGIDYDANSPNASVATNGGMFFETPILIWVYMPAGASWSSNSLPDSKLVLNYGLVQSTQSVTQIVTNYYRNSTYPVKNTNVHVDHHFLETILSADGTAFRVLNGNDGGIYFSDPHPTDPGIADGSWNKIGLTYNTAQFYGADKRPGKNEYLGGTQDNGSWITAYDGSETDPDKTTAFWFTLSGDGFEAVWNGDGQSYMVASQNNGLARNRNLVGTNPFATLEDAGSGSLEGTSPFLSRIANNWKDLDAAYVITSLGVWKTADFGGKWQLADMKDGWNNPFSINVSDADPNIVWAGGGMFDGGAIYVSTDAGLSFEATNNFASIGLATDVVGHPLDANTAFALFSVADQPKVLRTKDLGQTWEDLSGFSPVSTSTGFPDVATFSLVVMPHQPTTMWAGTEIGIFETTDDGQSWHILEGFPPVSVWELNLRDDQIVIATHGRGIWSVTIPEIAEAELPAVTLTPRVQSFGQADLTGLSLSANVELRSAYETADVLLNGVTVQTISANTENQLVSLDLTSAQAGEQVLQVVAKLGTKEFKSVPVTISTTSLNAEPVESYQNPFNNSSDGADFSSTGTFSVRTVANFQNQALHTAHPYLDETSYIALLTKPIIVGAVNDTLKYSDVAIIEPGNPGTVFGDQAFWDYVVVEGTKDGNSWIPLAPGYDARANSAWLAAYNSKSAGTSSMFVDHEIKITDTFQPGDLIAIRFRLFADVEVNSWGWAIDNLNIQVTDNVVTSINNPELLKAVSLYPNPVANGTLKVRFDQVMEGNVNIEIYDASGRMISSEQVFNTGGTFEEELNTSGLKPGMYIVKLENGGNAISKKIMVE